MNAEYEHYLKSLKRQQQFSYSLSIVFHLIILTVLYLVQIDWNVSVPEFIEIQFAQGQVTRMEQPATSPPSPPQTKQPEKLQLPERRMIEPEQEVLPASRQDKFVPVEETRIVKRQETTYERPLPVSRDFQPGKKQMASFVTSEKLRPDAMTDMGDVEMESPYKIEGQAALRNVLFKILPEYPRNLQQEAVVKIRFTVLPNGTIGEMIPILKGSTTLENITMEAFKQWRFSPLPTNVPQVTEQGTITFRYILK